MLCTRVYPYLVAALCLVGGETAGHAATISYADAVTTLASSCGEDIRKLCRGVSLANNDIGRCLTEKVAEVSPQCTTTLADVTASIELRRRAQSIVARECRNDAENLCQGVVPGEAHILHCLIAASRATSRECEHVITDAGWRAQPDGRPGLSSQQIIGGLQAAAGAAASIDPALLAQEARENVNRERGATLPAWNQLSGLPQLTVEINFEYDSIAIVPDSYRAVGLIADALHNPILLGNKFLIVGHTDATGKREYNLHLSQRRADAIKDALSTTFAVPADTLFTVGVGEEEPIDPAHPDASINRRVQIFNIRQVE